MQDVLLLATNRTGYAPNQCGKTLTVAELVDHEGNPCMPGEFEPAPWYKLTLIDAAAAKFYFEQLGGEE